MYSIINIAWLSCHAQKISCVSPLFFYNFFSPPFPKIILQLCVQTNPRWSRNNYRVRIWSLGDRITPRRRDPRNAQTSLVVCSPLMKQNWINGVAHCEDWLERHTTAFDPRARWPGLHATGIRRGGALCFYQWLWVVCICSSWVSASLMSRTHYVCFYFYDLFILFFFWGAAFTRGGAWVVKIILRYLACVLWLVPAVSGLIWGVFCFMFLCGCCKLIEVLQTFSKAHVRSEP